MESMLPYNVAMLALLGALSGCNHSDSDDSAPAPSAELINLQALQATGFVSLGWGLPIGIEKLPASGNAVFRTVAEWRAAWSADASIPIPEIDFSKYMVVGLARSTGGCDGGLGIQKIESLASALIVHAWLGGPPPPPGTACTASLSTAMYFALVPQSPLPVEFVEHTWEQAHPPWSTQLQVQAEPYEEQKPKSGAAGGERACTPLVVPFAVRAGDAALPSQLQVKTVSVMQDYVTQWLQPASPSETGVEQRWITESDWLRDASPTVVGSKSEPVLRGVARGCALPAHKIDPRVRVMLSLAGPNGQVERTVFTTIAKAN